MKSSVPPTKTVDLELHWDKRAQEIAQSGQFAAQRLCKRKLEDYFDFLAEVKPAQSIQKQPAEIYARKFSF
jgi:hypothetical protein